MKKSPTVPCVAHFTRYFGWNILNVHKIVLHANDMTQTFICFKFLFVKFCLWTPWNEKFNDLPNERD